MADSLTSRFFNQVDRLSQERGRRYFLRGAVSFIEGGALSVHAGVQGTRLYDVDISIDKHVINTSCTCPAFEREFDPCKHIWAALLAAEQSGFLAALNSIPAPHLRGVAPKPLPRKVAASRRNAKNLLQASWKQQLVSLRTQLEAGEERSGSRERTERALHYFIDAEETVANSEIALQVGIAERKMDGQWGKLKFKRLSRNDIGSLGDSADRRILAMLLGALDPGDYGYHGYSSYAPGSNSFGLTPALWEIVLPLMCATGRCTLRQSGTRREYSALQWGHGQP